MMMRSFIRGCILLMALPVSGQPGTASIPTYPAPSFDAVAVADDDAARALRGDLPLYGRLLPVDVVMSRDAHVEVMGDKRVRRVRLTSEGALALELFYADMHLVDGASFSILDDTGRLLAGPFGHTDTGGSNLFSTPLVDGDVCVIELIDPLNAGPSDFRITDIGHAYRDVMEGACHVDVHCSPEGDPWTDAAAATVRISIVVSGGVGWCSGALVNNVRQDCKPYILSAWHCGVGSTTAHFALYKFYFGYQRPACGTGSAPASQFVTGAQLRAYSNDNGGNAGSDFMLLETNSAIPPTYSPFWSGWDATPASTSSADGVCIHHPTGAPKKVSSYTATLTTGHWSSSSGLLSHWRTNWVATPNGYGVTESGSSGAPLLKRDGSGNPVIIGTLSGSANQLSCTNPTPTSYFGKLSYHWTGNPNSTSLKLKAWLDPDNNGTLTLPGSSMPCAMISVVATRTAPAFRVFPNPALDVIHVELEELLTEDPRLLLRDTTGRIVQEIDLPPQHTHQIRTAGISHGAYLMQVIHRDASAGTVPVIISP